jgi:hypothetical protein
MWSTTPVEWPNTSRVRPVESRPRARTPHHVEGATDAWPVLDSLAPGGVRPARAAVGRQYACSAHCHERHIPQSCTHVRASSALGIPAAAQHHACAPLHPLRRQPSRPVEPVEGLQCVAVTAGRSLEPAGAFRLLHFGCVRVSGHRAAAPLLQRWARPRLPTTPCLHHVVETRTRVAQSSMGTAAARYLQAACRQGSLHLDSAGFEVWEQMANPCRQQRVCSPYV